MDKKVDRWAMVKRSVLLFILFVFIIFLGGCETIKGVYTGAFDGFKKDWESAKRVDEWMRENLW